MGWRVEALIVFQEFIYLFIYFFLLLLPVPTYLPQNMITKRKSQGSDMICQKYRSN